MSNLAVTFIELVRRAREGKGSSFYGYCPMCNKRTLMVLVATVANREIYGCSECNYRKTYAVK